ncbi:MAG: C69 family dipeptidase, partial [Bacteroidales bacterium]|nr:C69 family dipeptidase [Bacteroidales bacterium]
MKKILLSLSILLSVNILCAQVNVDEYEFDGANCTSIMVGRKASTDGSVMTSHTCDSWYRTWMRWEPAADHEDNAWTKVYKGTMHTMSPSETKGLEVAAEIPLPNHTYAYLNTAYPCFNEKQLAIGETTFSGPDTLRNKNGAFLIEELERVALQRCDNARDAIRLIGELIKEYGYGDSGEAITIADTKEVWLMEIMGEGPKKIGGIWAAQRVPDGEVGVSANIPRIKYLNRDDPDNFMCSDNIEKVAKKYGLWDGEGELIWYKAFGSSYSNGKNFREREWFIFNELAPSLKLDRDAEDLPFSVKPENKVDVRDVMRLLRSYYEGTDMDITRNLKIVDRNGDTIISPTANPWMGGNEQKVYNMLKPGTIEFKRGTAMSWCSYSFVAQLRDGKPDEIGGICWIGVENPGQSPRIPVYSGCTKMPSCFDRCGHGHYDEQTALWRYRKANKLAQVNWGYAKDIMYKNILRYEDKAME